MKVKELLKLIKQGEYIYPDFLNWTVALEQHPDYIIDSENCYLLNHMQRVVLHIVLTKKF